MSNRAILVSVIITLLHLLCYIEFFHASLHDLDLAAMKEIKNGLHDFPGSVFFDSWNFDSINPCN